MMLWIFLPKKESEPDTSCLSFGLINNILIGLALNGLQSNENENEKGK